MRTVILIAALVLALPGIAEEEVSWDDAVQTAMDNRPEGVSMGEQLNKLRECYEISKLASELYPCLDEEKPKELTYSQQLEELNKKNRAAAEANRSAMEKAKADNPEAWEKLKRPYGTYSECDGDYNCYSQNCIDEVCSVVDCYQTAGGGHRCDSYTYTYTWD